MNDKIVRFFLGFHHRLNLVWGSILTTNGFNSLPIAVVRLGGVCFTVTQLTLGINFPGNINAGTLFPGK